MTSKPARGEVSSKLGFCRKSLLLDCLKAKACDAAQGRDHAAAELRALRSGLAPD